ncbi:hypothetical protein ACTXJT_08640 [Corynebacterium casei]|uniref:hypothetical protein n=1 Tax=Corynebacterium casei TaxID=160386 RepID=UPI003FD26ABF
MKNYRTVESLAEELQEETESARSALIYAPNTVGKTRLAQHLKNRDPESVILYNSYVEDVFAWDNDRVILTTNPGSGLLKVIEHQGLDRAIIENFQNFTNDKIEPTIDFANGEISFGIHAGDDRSAEYIKISRAEESIFIWSVYYSMLSDAVDTLLESPEQRSTTDYDCLTLAVIDDPVSSMDDVRIVTVALALVDLIKRAASLDLQFLVTTHHALFFNVLFNSLSKSNRKKHYAYILNRGRFAGWTLAKQPSDSPFSYHMGIIEDIGQAIAENAIERNHFNQFRALLEKTASFLGYTEGWSQLLTGPDARLLTKVLNLLSHDRFAELESAVILDEYKSALKGEFETFLKEFRWKSAA